MEWTISQTEFLGPFSYEYTGTIYLKITNNSSVSYSSDLKYAHKARGGTGKVHI